MRRRFCAAQPLRSQTAARRPRSPRRKPPEAHTRSRSPRSATTAWSATSQPPTSSGYSRSGSGSNSSVAISPISPSAFRRTSRAAGRSRGPDSPRQRTTSRPSREPSALAGGLLAAAHAVRPVIGGAALVRREQPNRNRRGAPSAELRLVHPVGLGNDRDPDHVLVRQRDSRQDRKS